MQAMKRQARRRLGAERQIKQIRDRVVFFHRWLLENQRRFNYDVQIKNITDDVACLGIAGPRSREVLSKLTSSDLRDEAFPYLAFKTIELCGLSVQACRFSFTGKNIHICDVVI